MCICHIVLRGERSIVFRRQASGTCLVPPQGLSNSRRPYGADRADLKTFFHTGFLPFARLGLRDDFFVSVAERIRKFSGN